MMRAAAIGMALGLTSCSVPTTFAEASPYIKEAKQTGDYLNIRAEMPRTGIPGEVASALGDVVNAAATGLRGNFPGASASVKWVSVDARFGDGAFKDRFGNYVFAAGALRADKSGGGATEILNLIEGAEPGSGETVDETVRWCAERGALAATVHRFCDVLATSATLKSTP